MIIGVTGSIGSGKSTVCQYLRGLGYFVVDADAISRKLMMKNNKGYLQVVKLFGESIVQEDGEIDRAILANQIFKNIEAKKQLEAILHPLILETMKENTKKYFSDNPVHELVFWEVPLLFETNYHVHCDASVCVVADENLLVERVKRRSNLSEDEVRQRLQNQMLVEEKVKLADYVIYNQGPIKNLYEQVNDLLEKL